MTETLRIIKVKEDDLDAVVKIHLLSFPGFFLTKIGPGFLKCYYREIINYEGGCLLAAQNAGRIIGFVAGFQNPKSFYKRMLYNSIGFLRPLFLGIVRHPNLIFDVLQKIVAFPGRCYSRKCLNNSDYRKKIELSSLAVSPFAREKGVGRQLVDTFISNCQVYAPAIIFLTTDAFDNDPVNSFYQKLGFVPNEYNIDGGRGRLMKKYELFLT